MRKGRVSGSPRAVCLWSISSLSHPNITVRSNWIRAWVEALQIYEDIRSAQYTKTEIAVKPNFITVNAIITALERANQSEIAESIYKDAVRDKIVSPWKLRHDIDGKLRMMLVSVNQSFLFFLYIYPMCLNSEVALYRCRIFISSLHQWQKLLSAVVWNIFSFLNIGNMQTLCL